VTRYAARKLTASRKFGTPMRARKAVRGQSLGPQSLLVWSLLLLLLRGPALAGPPPRDAVAMDMGSPDARWEEFLRSAGGKWRGEAEAATGRLRWTRGTGIPWIPGRGNTLEGTAPADPLQVLSRRAEEFVRERRELLGLAGFELSLDEAYSRSVGTPPYLYVLHFRVLASGIPVQDARVTFIVNNGNLVSFSANAPVHPPALMPPVRDPALSGQVAATELARGTESRRPGMGPANLVWRYSGGEWILAREGLVRDGLTGILRKVTRSASSGAVLESRSLRADGQATGGVRILLQNEPQTLMPLRGVTVFDGTNTEVTDSAGRFTLTGSPPSENFQGLLGTLSGPYSSVLDGCGDSSVSGDSTGLAFGATFRTDCVSSVPGPPGDNSASRTATWHVNRIRDLYRAYDAQSAWLDDPATIRTNFMEECANYFDGENIVLNWNGGSQTCSNAGDGGEEVDHEWGHAYQWETKGFFADAATREAYGNVTSLLQFHNHCIGRGFWLSGLGITPTCSGFQETEFAGWDPPLPALPQNVGDLPYSCPSDTSINGGGIAGYEGHCEGHIMTQAMFELGTALAQKYGTATGWDKLLRLWIAAGPMQIHAWRVTNTGPPIVADGCDPSNWFETLRIADDDDGDLSNGVPDGAEIFAAFNHHGIACPLDPFADVDVPTCPALQAPSVFLTYSSQDDSETVSWTPVPGATAYRVLRSELGPEGAFTPIATTGPEESSYVDPDGTKLALHWYSVVALGTGNCESPLATVVPSTPCVPAVALAEPFGGAVVNPAEATLSWTRGSNATTYGLFLSTASDPASYLQTSETSLTIPAGSLAPGSTYWWKVSSFNAVARCPAAISEVRSFEVSGVPAEPTLGGIQPAFGPDSGGTPLTLSGADLYVGASVTIGGLPTPITSWGDGSTLVVMTPPHAAGPVDVVITNPDGRSATLSSAFRYYSCTPPPLTIQAPATAFSGQGDLVASVTEDPAYVTYTWAVQGGEIASGQGTSSITFRAAMPGILKLTVTGTPVQGCSPADPASAMFTVVPQRTAYYTLAPCRVVDTRAPAGLLGAPSLQAGGTRTLPIAGTCGIPADASAVALNVTVTNASSAGFVSIVPSGLPHDLSTISFAAGATRANLATVSVVGVPSGSIDATAVMTSGTVDLVVDVSGYYRPGP
jgi:hypothetical protein